MQMRYRLITLVAASLIAVTLLCSSSCGYLRYRQHVERVKASVLRDNLSTMRRAIKEYKEDRKQAPQSLEDLLQAGYLSIIPADPVTESETTWLLDRENLPLSAGKTPGITNVRSGAVGDDPDGIPYSKY